MELLLGKLLFILQDPHEMPSSWGSLPHWHRVGRWLLRYPPPVCSQFLHKKASWGEGTLASHPAGSQGLCGGAVGWAGLRGSPRVLTPGEGTPCVCGS